MTITDLIPGLRGTGTRRAVDEVDRLRDENIKLLNRQAAADDFFAIQAQLVTDLEADVRNLKEKAEQAKKVIAQLENLVRLRDRQIDDLNRKIQVGVKAEHVIAKTQEIDASKVRHRVRTLHDAADTGLLSPIVRVSDSGASANPGQPPVTWGRNPETTQQLPRIPAA